ncbi:MAG: ribonuclease R [Ruminococcus sp.]|nr:ribonuclease R [Ruminococcus sp.]
MSKKKNAKSKSSGSKKSVQNKKASIRNFKNKILVFLNKNGNKPIPKKELASKCKADRDGKDKFYTALEELTQEGLIMQKKKGIVLTARLGYFSCEVKRLNKTFGFIQRLDSNEEIFVPGKYLMGALPGDIVLANYIESRTGSPEGEIVSIIKENNAQLTGKIELIDGEYYFLSDSFSKNHICISKSTSVDFKDGDKVMAEIYSRGKKHIDHVVRIVYDFGTSERASSCAMSILADNGVNTEFPNVVLDEARHISHDGIQLYDYNNRKDFRDVPIFTIDGADSKDLDDAISISKHTDGYTLGVHIADVSHYVTPLSELDKEALNRGTSIYYANRVVPMLPKELSNGICSLNPNEDRLTFSATMELSKEGELLSYSFDKSVIRSRVKGVYSEVNQILDGSATEDIKQKYSEVYNNIFIMNELADILIANKKRRGCPEIVTSESKLIIDENDVCIDIKPRTRGKSEMIIEEFMLLANQSSAKFARKLNIPFVYRVHEVPSIEKVERLKECLLKLNVKYPQFSDIKPSHMADILQSAKNTDKFELINTLVLRSMAKAKYDKTPIGHFGLVLKDYAHFTSPIRRYPDLAIHRILSDVVQGYDQKYLTERYESFVQNASEQSSKMELVAMNVERSCEDCYKAEYMKSHVGEIFEGIITSVTDFGFYVQLSNTVEGLVHINTLPDDIYESDGMFSIKGQFNKRIFTAGDRVKVICTKTDVNSGNIDFEIFE